MPYRAVFGHPASNSVARRKLSDYQRAEAIKRHAAGETLAAIAKSADVAGVVNTLPAICRTLCID